MLDLIIEDHYAKFLKALKSDEAKRQGPIRLKYFFDSFYTKEDPADPSNDTFIPLTDMNIKDQINDFMAYKNDNKKILKLLKHFVRVQKRRVKAGKIAAGTVWNYYKAAKLFCSENDIKINWKKISRQMPYSNGQAQDRIPDEEEIKNLIEYPDKRIKGIVCTMISSGMKIGSWDYLQWKHITPIKDENNNRIVAAKIIITDTKNDNNEYFSFITPEAYKELDKWREYRKKHGEDVNDESYVLRNLFEATTRNEVNEIKIQNPIKLKPAGVKSLLERAAESQKLFKPLEKGKHRRDWKLANSMRKFFTTQCKLAGLNSMHIEMLLGNDTGSDSSYHIPTEKQLLEDYLKAVQLLTIGDENKSKDKIKAEIREIKNELMQEVQNELNKIKKESLIIKFDNVVDRWINKLIVDYYRKGTKGKEYFSAKDQYEYFIATAEAKRLAPNELQIIKTYSEDPYRCGPRDIEYEDYTSDQEIKLDQK